MPGAVIVNPVTTPFRRVAVAAAPLAPAIVTVGALV